MSTSPKTVLQKVGLVAALGVLVYFFGILEMARGDRSKLSLLHWLYINWNPAFNMEHGILVPFLMAAMLFIRREAITSAALSTDKNWLPNNLAIGGIVLGGIFYLAAFRTLQPRIALVALPLVLWSCVWFLWGWRTARVVAFPLFFFWIAIPLPSFQHATIGLQKTAIQFAKILCEIGGVETVLQGSNISAKNGDWGPFNIAGGCSGIRSLFSLLMVAGTYAFITNLKLWKFILFLIACLPVAIIGNAFRTASICLMAHYGDPKFAATTWHDWSGALVFFPISMICLVLLHQAIERKSLRDLLFFKNTRKTTVRKVTK